MRYIGEQHVKEDLGRIPTAQDWLSQIKPANAGCMVSVSPIGGGTCRRSQPQRRKPSASTRSPGAMTLEVPLPGISKWPHLAQTNAPSARAIIGMNSLPTTQYGHRTTRSVIAAAPLAVEVNEHKDPRLKEPSENDAGRGMLDTVSLLASNE